jgi:hypothetical protein
MTDTPPPRPTPTELLRATRPWWIVPIVLILLAGLYLAFADSAPLRSLTYSVM